MTFTPELLLVTLHPIGVSGKPPVVLLPVQLLVSQPGEAANYGPNP